MVENGDNLNNSKKTPTMKKGKGAETANSAIVSPVKIINDIAPNVRY